MSWMRSRSQQQNLPGSQRETSPLPAPCSLSQTSQSSTTRVLGADITNRSPTPPPPSLLISKAVARTRSAALTTSPPSSSSTVRWPIRQTETFPCSSPHDHGGDASDSARTAVPFVLPSYDTFLDALGGGRSEAEELHLPATRRRSRPPAATELLTAEKDNNGDSQSDPQERREEEEKASLGQSSTQFAAKTVQENGTPDQQPVKRARLHSNTHGRASSPTCQRNETCRECASNATETGKSLLSAEVSWKTHTRTETSGGDNSANNCFTSVSTNMPLCSSLYCERVFSPAPTSNAECASFDPYKERQSGVPVAVPPSSTWATSALSTLPSSRRGLAHLCMPARLLDVEVPSWQVMTAAAVNTDEPTAVSAVTPQGHRRMRIVNSVDSTIVYSPGSLEDISPILCLSDEGAVLQGDTRGSLSRGTPAHLRNEEAFPMRKDNQESCEMSVGTPVAHPLFSQVNRDYEEEGEMRDTHLREDVLHVASDAFENLQRCLRCWQK
ncbi:hypothetical protein ABB37_01517 [Leptomonas pyrrhocoris]|uniref:Uncharacterized protein n=1 Tax=Leptomonas pyrrhocoris TaxID=157538 RepID=A0A0N0DZC5_LEPPY|nr:hypothetical protein ABB37_01517 [Leptomonas pyrrhocoris]KPA85132.1 hypothetical protein ABB37_01517 [Leptomonas pyrrhocoris]|eukprot:XP_015663571.1 hypothetical protein ABB37_01517 [Leptomonas pyrrhocoris]